MFIEDPITHDPAKDKPCNARATCRDSRIEMYIDVVPKIRTRDISTRYLKISVLLFLYDYVHVNMSRQFSNLTLLRRTRL
jgi:hypothetical protein